VTVVLKSQAFSEQKITLADDLSDSATSARLTSTRDLPEAPGLVRIDGEWMEYRSRDFNSISISKRGVRGTAKTSHTAGTEVMFGETFTRTLYLPIRQEAIRK
jgi:hypothetical protein